MFNLDSFGPEFWSVRDENLDGACLKHSGGKPTSVEQALWEMPMFPDWMDMVRSLFAWHPQDVGIDDVMTLIRETNTCSNLDSPVEVWIDEGGDFKIKVYGK